MRRRLEHLRAAVPLPLGAMLLVATFLTLAWGVAQPPFNGPDEIGHFAYTQKIVEERTIPWYRGGAPQGVAHGPSQEAGVALVQSGAQALEGNVAMKDTRREVDERIWRAADAALPPDAEARSGFMATMLNPPLYYLYETVPYAATSHLGIFDRIAAMRLANLPLVLAIVVSAWMLAGLLVGPRRSLQVLATSVVAMNAQLLSVAATVNADALVAALFSVAFVLIALILLRGPTRGRVVWLVLVAAAAGLTHGRGLPLLLPAAATLGIAWWRARAPHGPRTRALAAAAIAMATAVVGFVVVRTATGAKFSAETSREFASYLWQFYLPKLPFMEEGLRTDWSVRDVFIDRFWGVFGQLDTTLSPSILEAIAFVAQAGLAVFAVVLVARWRTTARAGALLAVFVLALGGYLLALHVAGYRSLISGEGDPVITGRYLMPFVVLLGAAVAVAVSWLPRRALPVAAGLVVFSGFALQLASLGALVTRMHA